MTNYYKHIIEYEQDLLALGKQNIKLLEDNIKYLKNLLQ